MARHLGGRVVDPVVHDQVVWAVEQRLLEELMPALDTRLTAMLDADFEAGSSAPAVARRVSIIMEPGRH